MFYNGEMTVSQLMTIQQIVNVLIGLVCVLFVVLCLSRIASTTINYSAPGLKYNFLFCTYPFAVHVYRHLYQEELLQREPVAVKENGELFVYRRVPNISCR